MGTAKKASHDISVVVGLITGIRLALDELVAALVIPLSVISNRARHYPQTDD